MDAFSFYDSLMTYERTRRT